ncbi:Inhibitor of growth 1 [Solea senegalensis]|uniref:Inhibitor of growth 1 n=1 Tax=Solea senegalensis TaxID=28829 RepID=A0AAV6T382_SOLSE|nr:Inhibitor of growth 1 [Solea senegalensis]
MRTCVPGFENRQLVKLQQTLERMSAVSQTELRNDEVVHMDYSDVLSMCKHVEMSVSEEQAKAVEAATRDQASSKLWFRFRAGQYHQYQYFYQVQTQLEVCKLESDDFVVWTEKDLHSSGT